MYQKVILSSLNEHANVMSPTVSMRHLRLRTQLRVRVLNRQVHDMLSTIIGHPLRRRDNVTVLSQQGPLEVCYKTPIEPIRTRIWTRILQLLFMLHIIYRWFKCMLFQVWHIRLLVHYIAPISVCLRFAIILCSMLRPHGFYNIKY